MINKKSEAGKSRSRKILEGKDITLSARLAFIGLCYIYVVKILDTLLHGLFSNPVFSYSVVGLNFLAGVAQLYFYSSLYLHLSGGNRAAVLAGWLGIIGSSLNMLPKILALSFLAQHNFLIKFSGHYQAAAVVSPWLGAALLFTCCILLARYRPGSLVNKTRAFLSAAAGYFVLATAFSVLVLNYLSGVRINWAAGETGMPQAFLIVSSSFSFLCIAYFYADFFQHKNDV